MAVPSARTRASADGVQPQVSHRAWQRIEASVRARRHGVRIVAEERHAAQVVDDADELIHRHHRVSVPRHMGTEASHEPSDFTQGEPTSKRKQAIAGAPSVQEAGAIHCDTREGGTS